MQSVGRGALAQLVARFHGMEEVASSNLAGSTAEGCRFESGQVHPWARSPIGQSTAFRDMAQFGRARAWGARERWFKSSYPDEGKDPGSESLARAVKSARSSTAEHFPGYET